MNLFEDLSQALDTSKNLDVVFKKETSSNTIETCQTIVYNGTPVVVHFEFDGFDMSWHPINFTGREIEICGESWLDDLNDSAIARIYDMAEKILTKEVIDDNLSC